jgi:hypothetical protein
LTPATSCSGPVSRFAGRCEQAEAIPRSSSSANAVRAKTITAGTRGWRSARAARRLTPWASSEWGLDRSAPRSTHPSTPATVLTPRGWPPRLRYFHPARACPTPSASCLRRGFDRIRAVGALPTRGPTSQAAGTVGGDWFAMTFGYVRTPADSAYSRRKPTMAEANSSGASQGIQCEASTRSSRASWISCASR